MNVKKNKKYANYKMTLMQCTFHHAVSTSYCVDTSDEDTPSLLFLTLGFFPTWRMTTSALISCPSISPITHVL